MDGGTWGMADSFNLTHFFPRSPKSLDALESAQSEEEVDELSLIDHNEIMSRLTLKQEVRVPQTCFLYHQARGKGE